jgi:hypothetical protein
VGRRFLWWTLSSIPDLEEIEVCFFLFYATVSPSLDTQSEKSSVRNARPLPDVGLDVLHPSDRQVCFFLFHATVSPSLDTQSEKPSVRNAGPPGAELDLLHLSQSLSIR